jgi:hypothetical protein
MGERPIDGVARQSAVGPGSERLLVKTGALLI